MAPSCYLRFKSLFLFELFDKAMITEVLHEVTALDIYTWFGMLVSRKAVYFNLDWGLSSTCKEQFRSQKAEII